MKPRHLSIRGTGCDLKGTEGKYIGTFQIVDGYPGLGLCGGCLVFHLFEIEALYA
jgi:hypothetical protein